ncbi:hypothetical protein [Brachybacterium subflavum]|uniref:hypothetical protein n=1 Tax=Brachybacterium subflavum TaxID=2585206 RepID=UPI0012663D3D|nr:hypothetical protein [Brachybacterium subflavum]
MIIWRGWGILSVLYIGGLIGLLVGGIGASVLTFEGGGARGSPAARQDVFVEIAGAGGDVRIFGSAARGDDAEGADIDPLTSAGAGEKR